MKTYSYVSHVKQDIKDLINQQDTGTYGLLLQDDDDTIQNLKDECFDDDSITGNQSGSYTMSRFKAELCLLGNWDLLEEAHDELCPDVDIVKEGPEYADSLIRCYLVDWCFNEALNEIVNNKNKGEINHVQQH